MPEGAPKRSRSLSTSEGGGLVVGGGNEALAVRWVQDWWGS